MYPGVFASEGWHRRPRCEISTTIPQSKGHAVNLTSDRNSQFSSRWVPGIRLWLIVAILATVGQQAAAADFPVPDTADPLANGAALVAAINAAMRTAEED